MPEAQDVSRQGSDSHLPLLGPDTCLCAADSLSNWISEKCHGVRGTEKVALPALKSLPSLVATAVKEPLLAGLRPCSLPPSATLAADPPPPTAILPAHHFGLTPTACHWPPSAAALRAAYNVHLAVTGLLGAISLLWHLDSPGSEITHMGISGLAPQGLAARVYTLRGARGWSHQESFQDWGSFQLTSSREWPWNGGEPSPVSKCTAICILVCVWGGVVPGIHHTSHLTTKPPCEGLTQRDSGM